MRLVVAACAILALALCLSLVVNAAEETRVVIGGEVVTLTDANFDAEVQPDKAGGANADYFVEFYAPWCGHCKSLVPTWKSLASSLSSITAPRPIRVGQVDCTVEVGQAKRFGIKGFPSLKFFSQGRVYEYKGARTLDALETFAKTRGAGLDASPIPNPPTQVEIALEHFLTWSGDVQQILVRKPAVAAIFFAIGLMLGVLTSVIVFATCVEKLVSGEPHHVASTCSFLLDCSSLAAPRCSLTSRRSMCDTPSHPPALSAWCRTLRPRRNPQPGSGLKPARSWTRMHLPRPSKKRTTRRRRPRPSRRSRFSADRRDPRRSKHAVAQMMHARIWSWQLIQNLIRSISTSQQAKRSYERLERNSTIDLSSLHT
jgi:thioredoxin domain-containing protein 5